MSYTWGGGEGVHVSIANLRVEFSSTVIPTQSLLNILL